MPAPAPRHGALVDRVSLTVAALGSWCGVRPVRHRANSCRAGVDEAGAFVAPLPRVVALREAVSR